MSSARVGNRSEARLDWLVSAWASFNTGLRSLLAEIVRSYRVYHACFPMGKIRGCCTKDAYQVLLHHASIRTSCNNITFSWMQNRSDMSQPPVCNEPLNTSYVLSNPVTTIPNTRPIWPRSIRLILIHHHTSFFSFVIKSYRLVIVHVIVQSLSPHSDVDDLLLAGRFRVLVVVSMVGTLCLH